MSDPVSKLRAVGDGERPARIRRGPGLAVILVAVYALAFAVALWWIKGQALGTSARKASGAGDPAGAPAGASRIPRDRQDLLSGASLQPEARAEYFERLAVDCCDCGCDMTLSRCLVGDQKCSRSAQMADERRRPLE